MTIHRFIASVAGFVSERARPPTVSRYWKQRALDCRVRQQYRERRQRPLLILCAVAAYKSPEASTSLPLARQVGSVVGDEPNNTDSRCVVLK